MLITDHLNLVGMIGANPLRGPIHSGLRTALSYMSRAYDRDLRRLAAEVAVEAGLPLHQGVYVGLTGPTFETPADIRFLRLIGADAVGMSTVPEVIVARHGGMRVLGISGISNVAIDQIDTDGEASHDEVLQAGEQLAPRMTTLIKGVLAGCNLAATWSLPRGQTRFLDQTAYSPRCPNDVSGIGFIIEVVHLHGRTGQNR